MSHVYAGGKYDEPVLRLLQIQFFLQLSWVFAAYRLVLKLDRHAIEMVLLYQLHLWPLQFFLMD